MLKDMGAFKNVAAGQTATNELPTGLTYHAFLLGLTIDGVAATKEVFSEKVKEVRLKLDNEIKQQLTGIEFIKLLDGYYGQKSADGAFFYPLTFKNARLIATEDELAYGTSDIQTASLEVEFKDGSYAPALTLKAEVTAGTPLGRHLVRKRQILSFSDESGEFEIDNIPTGNYGLVALHFGTDKMDEIEVEINNVKVWDQEKKDIPMLQAYGREWQPGYFHMDLAYNNRTISSAISLKNLQDFRLRAKMSGAAPSLPTIIERIEGRAVATS